MTFAYWMVLVAALLPYAATAYAKFSGGGARTYDNRAPRAQMEALPLQRRRAHWAQLNGFEAFPAFAAAVIIAHLAGASQVRIDALAALFVTARLFYTAFYIYDKATARSLAWAVGLACVIGLFMSAAL